MIVPEFIENIDVAILTAVQSFDSPVLTRILGIITLFGNSGIGWILLTLVLLAIPKTRKMGAAMALALIFSLVVTNLTLKPLVARVRPYDLYDFLPRIEAPHDLSFPSGHASVSFAGAAAFWAARDGRFKGIGIALWVLAGLIALSRVLLLVHYPSDVVGGTIVGILCGVAAAAVVGAVARKFAAGRRAA